MWTRNGRAGRRADHLDDRVGDGRHVGVGRNDRAERLVDLLGETLRGTGLVLREARGVGWMAGVSEVIRPLREGAGNDDRRLDSPARELARVLNRQRVHRRLGREIGRQERRCATGRAAARDPDQQPLAPLAHVRKRGAVDPLRAEHVLVVELGELLGREALGRSECHVAGVVHDHVEVAVPLEDGRDGGIDRRLGSDVELEGVQIHGPVARVGCGRGHLGRVAPGRLAHARVDRVARVSQRVGRQASETAGSAGDQDDVLHDGFSFCGGCARRAALQTTPPLARRT